MGPKVFAIYAYSLRPYDILFVGEAMARGKLTEDTSTLQMALVGYQIEKEKIEAKISEIQAQLKGKRTPVSAGAAKPEPAAGKRYLSPAARKRIALAQKKRWAEHRKKAAQAAKEA
jgi:hypothetical protein